MKWELVIQINAHNHSYQNCIHAPLFNQTMFIRNKYLFIFRTNISTKAENSEQNRNAGDMTLDILQSGREISDTNPSHNMYEKTVNIISIGNDLLAILHIQMTSIRPFYATLINFNESLWSDFQCNLTFLIQYSQNPLYSKFKT